MENNDYALYNYVFHYNAHNKNWAAIPREMYNDYWSDSTKPGILRSKSIDTLTELIYKTGGDAKKLSKLVSEK